MTEERFRPEGPPVLHSARDPKVRDVSTDLLGALARLGDEYGALGVAHVAAALARCWLIDDEGERV